MLRAVATDGHRLAQVELPLPSGAKDMPGVIVPRKTVLELAKLVEDGEGEVRIELSPSKIRVSTARVVLTSKLIDGTFPDYERVIPQGNDKRMEVDNAAFAQAVDRVSTLSSDKGRAVKLTLTDGKLTLSVNNPDSGSATEELAVDYGFDPLEIGFNARYLLDISGSSKAARPSSSSPIPAPRPWCATARMPRRSMCSCRCGYEGARDQAIASLRRPASPTRSGFSSARSSSPISATMPGRARARCTPVVLIGDNGSGKTNLLEAVSLLGPGQGLRGRPYSELARKDGAGGFAVAAKVVSRQGEVEIGTGFLGTREESTGRTVRIAGKERARARLASMSSTVPDPRHGRPVHRPPRSGGASSTGSCWPSIPRCARRSAATTGPCGSGIACSSCGRIRALCSRGSRSRWPRPARPSPPPGSTRSSGLPR